MLNNVALSPLHWTQINCMRYHQAASSTMFVLWNCLQVDVAEWLTPRVLSTDEGIAKQWASNGYKHFSAPHMPHLRFYFNPRCQPLSQRIFLNSAVFISKADSSKLNVAQKQMKALEYRLVHCVDVLVLQIRQTFPRSGDVAGFKWKDYSPLVFRRLRGIFGIDDADYMLSLTGDS